MKIRPQKHQRQGFSGKAKRRSSAQPKTRKEIRKDKRQQKKVNRCNYHSRKRADRFQHDDQEQEGEKRKRKAVAAGSDEEEDEFDDEEIDSDLEGEQEEKLVAPVKAGKLSQMEKERQEELRELKSYEQGLKEKRIAQLEAANEEDDAIIKKYEKLLKINRRKNKVGVPKSFNDGLDYALELCSEENIRKMYDAAREAADMEQNSEDEFADDMGEVLGKKKEKVVVREKDRKRMEKLREVEKKYLGDDEMDSLGGFDSELEIELDSNAEEDYSDNDELYSEGDSEISEEEQEPAPKKKKKAETKSVTFKESESPAKKKSSKSKKKQQQEPEPEEDSEFDEDVFGGESDDMNDGLDDLLEGSDPEDEPEPDSESDKEKDASETWEDIYGRKRDQEGNVLKENVPGGKYVPPALRARMEAAETTGDSKRQEKLARLKRQLKGQVNRLAESNVHRISIELDNCYMQNARFDMNSILTTLILEATVSHSLSPERMILEHALLVTILHANVGSEVGSHFLETVVERFCGLVQQIESFDVEDKTLDNCVLILCHLYTFQIFKSKLIYDVIDRLLEKFNEKAVECILLVLRAIGFVLRKDDPLALKEMIQKVQRKAQEAPVELKTE